MRNKKSPIWRTFGMILFWVSSAVSAAEVSCYTVQLTAMQSEEQASAFIRDQQLRDRCRVVPIPGFYSIRCAPEQSRAIAIRNLEFYKKTYPSAWVNLTQRHLVETLFSTPGQEQSGCSQQRAELDTVVLPDSLMVKESEAGGSISEILGRIESVRDEYLKELNERGSFKGFYVRSQFDRDTQTNDERELLFLEWELFDEGWHESKKQLDEKRVETKLQFLQLLRNMRERNLHEALFQLQGVTNSVRFHEAKKRFDVIKSLLTRYEEQLEEGYATQEELQEMRYKYESAQNDINHYSRLDQRGISQRDFDIVNKIEFVSLASVDNLTAKAVDNSYDLRIQELFISRSEFFPQWVDNLSLRLYAGADRGFGDDRRDNVVGVRLRIPIDFKRGRANLIDIEQSAFRDQQQAISMRLEQKTNRLYELFQFHQKRIKTTASEYRLVKKHRGLKEKQRSYPLSALPTVPDKEIDRLTIELLTKEEDILLARLDAFKILLQLEALVMPDSLSELVVN